ncbi:MAG: thioesterase family protein [Myxococcota bacterium]
MAFIHQTRVRFHEADPAGIAFFAGVLTWCHVAYEELLQAADLPLARILAEGRWALPLVHAEADYRQPCRYGAEVKVEVVVAELGDRRFTLAYRVLGPEGACLATARTVHVVVDRGNGRPASIPDELRAVLAAHQAPPA